MIQENSLTKEKLANLFFSYLQEEHNVTSSEIIILLQKSEPGLVFPAGILGRRELGSFEAIVKYLREEKQLSFKDISKLTGRSRATVGVSYYNASKKLGQRFSVSALEDNEYCIPISILRPRVLSVLESIVVHLKETHKLSYHKIAVLINRDDRTIWTVYQRAVKKRQNEK